MGSQIVLIEFMCAVNNARAISAALLFIVDGEIWSLHFNGRFPCSSVKLSSIVSFAFDEVV
jgi:hypothetical protein